MSIEAQCGKRGVAVVVFARFQRLHGPSVGIREVGGKRCRHADGDVPAREIRDDGDRILGNAVGVEYTGPAQLSGIVEGSAGQ